MALLTPLADNAAVQEHVDNMPIVFVQDANNIGNREFVVDEQVADSYLSLRFGIQTGGIRRDGKLPPNGETINGVSH